MTDPEKEMQEILEQLNKLQENMKEQTITRFKQLTIYIVGNLQQDKIAECIEPGKELMGMLEGMIKAGKLQAKFNANPPQTLQDLAHVMSEAGMALNKTSTAKPKLENQKDRN